MKLKIARELALPVDAVTQTFLVVGKRGSGKSNTAARFVEQLHYARLPFVVLDPVDTWWGLKAGRDGGPGLDVYVFGGRKADLPLPPDKGALLAEVLCEHRISMVLSVKHLSGRERSTFMVAFAQTLFQRWSGGPLHLVLEEAHELAPQSTQNAKEGEQQMLGAFKRLWKLGRSSGIGGTAVTQRPASLSKDITTQSEVLVAHRTIGPQDVKAIGEWVKYHGQHDDILADLPTLPTGQAFVWAPEFPSDKPVGLQRVTVQLRDTYDSASTPKVGEQRQEPKELTPVDLKRLEQKMAATIERAKQEDPKELRRQLGERDRRIRELERSGGTKTVPVEKVVEQRVEIAVLKDSQITQLGKAVDRMGNVADRLVTVGADLRGLAGAIVEGIHAVRNGHRHARPAPAARAPVPARTVKVTPPPVQTSAGSQPRSSIEGEALPPGERKILTAIAQYPEGVQRDQLSVLSGYKRTSRDTYIGRLAGRGFVEAQGPGAVMATPAGIAALGPEYEPLPTGHALREYWMQRLSEGERRILEVLVGAYPEPVERTALDEATGYRRTSRDTYLGRLAARRLVESPRAGVVRASDTLFEETGR